jgi:hypothetical protein
MIVLTASHLTYAAATLLLDPQTPERQVAHVMRELGRSEAEHDTLRAISDLAHYLDTLDTLDTPIDYAGRRALDYAHLLPETLWKHI